MSQSILDVPDEHLTPGMKQYKEIKESHPDCLVMLRMGDFYEMFYQDAVTASKALEITLTARGQGEKRAPLAGIPFHALDTYLGRLVKQGLKVAIVEQLEDPKLAKGLVKRGLARIVSPGTVIESSLLNEKENNYVMALTSSLTSVGDIFSTAFCDISTGEFFAMQLEGEHSLLTELARCNPAECIIPDSLRVNGELISIIKNKGCFVNPVDDHFFKISTAKEALLQHFKGNQFKGNESQGNNFKGNMEFHMSDSHLIASGALMRYLQETQKNDLQHIRKIVLKSRDVMALDSATLRNLELLKNIHDGSARGSLISVLDRTATPLGARLLRRGMKEPLVDKDKINQRLDALESFNKQVILREEVISLLQNVGDLERLIGRINYGTATPRDLIALQQSLQQIPSITAHIIEINRLAGDNVGLLRKIIEWKDLQDVARLIGQAIISDPPLSIREGGIIATGYHQELDQLRDIKKNSRKFLQELEQKEKEKTGIPTLKLGFTRVFGYFIEVTKKNIPSVPAHYIRKQTTANSERYITEELKVEEEKILGAEEKINNLEYLLFQDIIRQIAQRTADVQDTAQRIATLDVLTSLAKVSMENNYTKPAFVDEDMLHIKNGRHPVIETIEQQFIANDVILNPGEMMIISGSNMSGKSTVMRQTALIVLMAQMGCFVPAEEAVLGIVDRIFTRVGASDNLSSGQSTFMVEMQETASILHHATDKSLIILDEIGRGTSTFDGVSIAWSVAEHISKAIQAKTLFATHYHVLHKLAENLPKVHNYSMAVKEVHQDIVMLHKLVQGSTDQSHGIHVAKLAGIPENVIFRAKEIQAALEKEDAMVRKIKASRAEEQRSLAGF